MKNKHLGFKIAVAVLFMALLATYGFYWLNLTKIQNHSRILADALTQRQAGEAFHSATHLMLLEAEAFLRSGGDPAFRDRFLLASDIAAEALKKLEDHTRDHEAIDSSINLGHNAEDIDQGFLEYRKKLEAVFSGDQSYRRDGKSVENPFDDMFRKHYLGLHDHHTLAETQLQAETENMLQAMTILFVCQLIFAVAVGILVIAYLDRVVLKIFNFTEKMAFHDQLTGLGNRLALERLMAAQDADPSNMAHVYSVLMIDVDHFKQFNDNYGHQAGDRLLKDLGTVIVGNVRKNQDRVIRYGGEGLLVFLPGTDAGDAFKAAEKIRERVDSHRFVLPNGQTTSQRVTISIGVGSRPLDGHLFRQVAEHADRRLYRAKENGRNRTIGSDSRPGNIEVNGATATC